MKPRICSTCGHDKADDPYCRPCARRIALRWAAKFPERKQAHKQVAWARKWGFLVKPDWCQRCREEYAAVAHHEDYSKPLQVWWLCDVCHKQRHAELKQIASLLDTDNNMK